MIDRVAEVVGPGTWNNKLLGACAGGHAGLVAEAIANGADNFAEAFVEACQYGHDEIAAAIERDHGIAGIDAGWLLGAVCVECNQWAIDRSLSLGATEWTRGLVGACSNGTSRGFEVARDMISRGAVVDEWCAWNICAETRDANAIKDLDFVKYIIGQIGKDDTGSWGRALIASMLYSFPEIFDIVVEEYERRVIGGKIIATPEVANQVLYSVARSCNETAIDRVLAYGANDYDLGLMQACGSGSSWAEYIADKFIALGAQNLDAGLRSACNGGNSAMVAAMIARGATDFNGAMGAAARNGHYSCVVEMLEHGAGDIAGAITAATANNRADMVEFLTARM